LDALGKSKFFMYVCGVFIKYQCRIMKYSELERLLKKTTKSRWHHDGTRHPVWYNSETDDFFEMSFHKSEEVAKGTLNDILKKSGAKNNT